MNPKKAELIAKFTVNGSVDVLGLYDHTIQGVRAEPDKYLQPDPAVVESARAALAQDIARRDLAADPITAEEADIVLTLTTLALAADAASREAAAVRH